MALENILNIQLFECNRQGIVLTVAGEAVRLRAQAIEAELREVRDDAARIGAQDSPPACDMEVLFNHRCLRTVSMLADVQQMPNVARAMGMSQSAASQMIAELENVLGRALFRHTAHSMVPSDVGIRWIVRFNKVLAQLDNIVTDIAGLKYVVEA